MFFTPDQQPKVEIVPGVRRQTVAHGERCHMLRIEAEAGVAEPLHSHPHEQLTTVISGEIEFTVNGEAHLLRPGEGYATPGGVPHFARFLVDSVVMIVFAPVREEYLP